MSVPSPMRTLLQLACRLLWTALMVCLPLNGWAQSENSAIESQVKAAFLYKFAGYVEWPPTAFERSDSPVVIGVVEAADFAQTLEQTVAGRSMNGRPVVVQRVARGDSLKGVHVLFIPRREAAALGDVLAQAKGLAILTVTDTERGLGAGCMINFVVENNKVRFDIAPEAAELSRIKISARLMSVARRVQGRTS